MDQNNRSNQTHTFIMKNILKSNLIQIIIYPRTSLDVKRS